MLDPIPAVLDELRAGRLVVVVDDENRENEGDLVGAAQFATPEMINFMALYARGLICLAMTPERLDQLKLPLMVTENTDKNQTAFTVSIDAAPELGTTTGISASDRSRTVLAAINPYIRPEELRRPGHIFPLRAREGGVLMRAGHTEAAVDMARLSGLYPAGVICEIQNPDGSMARLPELLVFARQHNLKIISIADLISYRLQTERFVRRETRAILPTVYGQFEIFGYRNQLDNTEHVALVKGGIPQAPVPFLGETQPMLVRVHSECLTGDALGSLRCDCQRQLQAAMKMIDHAGRGVVVYLRQEGRGIGLVNKLKAYSLQDTGLDTVEANERLGFAADLRNYGVGTQILNDLGVRRMKLITNNPRKIAGLGGYGLEITDRVPLIVEETDFNSRYLTTKARKLGHILPEVRLLVAGLNFSPVPQEQDWLKLLEQIRAWAALKGLLVQEEVRPVGRAVFSRDACIFHLGLEHDDGQVKDWYRLTDQPRRGMIQAFLMELTRLENLVGLEFVVSDGQDPLGHLNQNFSSQDRTLDQWVDYCTKTWERQQVYRFLKPHS
ncbi:bifunctional 3,4-dihydroxy-2-butanone-4-phosphate synthase/GTP cyclohydrolase II [Candidatus Cyanaurora vandensis]|uniref:bifunctional 3,4-dihydroxy-2-butanone-4-phosphate synthase/GTP cyclohydrolase II n=1 Tax=Candidatus Cyanaurora vandensis TaxID=2714958 RepID=UPI00257AE771|nr:bifunctional 3,4-dihydroxy-2-butanone-4-phosphate synthase/GTP cyclohydrolase II [Candidatus Cyanaurora vandensis]